MTLRKLFTIVAFLLLIVLIVQPALSAPDITSLVTNNTAENVSRIVTNNTADLQKDNGTIFYNYGVQSLNIGDFENANRYFDKALAENTTMMNKTPVLQYLYENKAYVLIQLEKYNDAIATADAGLAFYPTDAMLWNNKGYALSRLGKPQDALKAYDTSISFDGNYTNAYINRGNVLTEMGRYSEAVAAYTKAGETDQTKNDFIAEKLMNAKNGEAQSTRTMTIILAIVLIAAVGTVVWYVKFRKPAEPEPEEKETKSKKK